MHRVEICRAPGFPKGGAKTHRPPNPNLLSETDNRSVKIFKIPVLCVSTGIIINKW